MKARFLSFWEDVRDSYWIVPLCMTIASLFGAHLLLEFDRAHDASWARDRFFVYSGGSEGARGVLSAIAGSVITVAGVVFSTTITSLTLASSQFGPRLLRSFVRDRANQFVLGVFTSTFAFCLIVLRSIRSADENLFVPYICVTVALGLALCSIGVLVFFLHHIADSIQIENVVARTARDWLHVIARNRPERLASDATQKDVEQMPWPEHFDQNCAHIRAPHSGYLQAIDHEAIVALAKRRGGVLDIEKCVGDFIAQNETWARGYPQNRFEGEEALWNSVAVGAHRNPTQDIGYPLQQLVEIALVALSPGVNIQFTATTCIDWIGVGLCEIARRGDEKTMFCDEDHEPRARFASRTFEEICARAFDAIRESGKNNLTTVLRLLDVLARLGECVEDAQKRQVLAGHSRQIARDALETASESDQTKINDALEAALRELSGKIKN